MTATKKKHSSTRAPKKKEPITSSIWDAVESAFEEAEELRGELENWYENMPDNIKNGQKGQDLQDTMSTLEGVQKPDEPEGLDGEVKYFEPARRKRPTRSQRLASCIARVDAAAGTVRSRIDDLDTIEYSDDDGELVDDNGVKDAPANVDERDAQVTSLSDFAEACETAVSEWEGVTFPSMYG